MCAAGELRPQKAEEESSISASVSAENTNKGNSSIAHEAEKTVKPSSPASNAETSQETRSIIENKAKQTENCEKDENAKQGIKKKKEEEEAEEVEEEVLDGDWTRPQVDVKEVEVKTGEEEEDVFWNHRAKLYRLVKAEWKERGIGDAKLLRHKVSGRVRFLLRQEKTLKVVANHYVLKTDQFCNLLPNVASDKIWVWSVIDYAETPGKLEQFGLKFGRLDAAKEFKEKFEEALLLNKTAIGKVEISS